MSESIKGYRALTSDEIQRINDVKNAGVALGEMLDALRKSGADERWLAISQTHLQEGIMAAVRAVAKPTGF